MKIRKLYAYVIIICLLFPLVIQPTVAYARITNDDIANMDITTKPSKDLTVEDIQKAFKNSGNGDSPFLTDNNAQNLLNASKRYGLNPYISLLMMIHEAGWKGSPVSKSNNNLGGVQCHTRAVKCMRSNGNDCKVTDPLRIDDYVCYAYYNNTADFFFDKAYLLREEYYEKGAKTFQQVLNVYSPAFENNHWDYLNSMSSNASVTFKVTLDDITSNEKLTPDESIKPEDSGVGGESSHTDTPFSKKDIEIFKRSAEEQIKLGLSNTGKTLEESPYVAFGVMQVTKKTYNLFITLSYLVIALAISYMALMVVVYALYVNNNIGHKMASKLIGESLANTYGERKGIIEIIKRMLFGIILIAFILSDTHVKIFSLFYKIIEGFIQSI